MWISARVLPLAAAFGLCACTGQQVKEVGKHAAIGTAMLAAEAFLGIEQPSLQDKRTDEIMEAHRQRQHEKRVAALTAEYEEYVREQAEPDAPASDPAPVVVAPIEDYELVLPDLQPLR